MGAKPKRASKVRNASEFNLSRLAARLLPPPEVSSVYAWTLAEIMSARDAQMRGQFAMAVRLAASMRTDDALAVARANRLAPQRCIRVEIVPAPGARGKGPAKEAEALYGQDGVAVSPGTRADINGCLVDHGVAFAYNILTPREDGSRIDIEVRYWPIEHVRWDSWKRCFVTHVGSSDDERISFSTEEEPIVHGDGRWIVFSTHDHEPFKQEAAVLPGALVWARHAFAIRDWAKSSVAHGSAKVIGEMPEGVALQDAAGLTAEAMAFAELLRAIATGDAPVGIRPAGSKTEFLTNNSTAWQIWTELVGNAEKAAARIYLGTDGTLGAAGGAPGVDISQLFGVALTKVQGDLAAITRGLQTGSIEIWCALNFGDSSLAPSRRYMIPDADADADRAATKERSEAAFAHIKGAKELGFVVDQKYVDDVSALYDVTAPKLPEATDAKVPTIALAPTDLARVVSVNEARASAGLGSLTLRDGTEDPDGYLTVEQFAEKKRAATIPAPALTPAVRAA
jgi:hypothetical protein